MHCLTVRLQIEEKDLKKNTKTKNADVK